MNILDNVPDFLGVDWVKALEEHKVMFKNPNPVQFPRVYQLETTSKCNLDCVFCPRQFMTRPKMNMPNKLFAKIVERDLKHTKALELFGFGDPLCDNMLEARVDLLHAYSKYVVMATNALLAGKHSDELFKKVDYMILDIDAVDAVNYERLRVGGKYEQMLENTQRIFEIRQKAKKYTVAQFINYDSTEKQRELFKEMYRDKCDELNIKFLDTFGGQVNKEYAKEQRGVKCMEPFYGLTIWSNGDVVMCDRDIHSTNRLGNVNDQSLQEIWEGTTAKWTQECHKESRGENIALCRNCKEWSLTNLRNVPEMTVNMFKGGFV